MLARHLAQLESIEIFYFCLVLRKNPLTSSTSTPFATHFSKLKKIHPSLEAYDTL